ncbi:ABC transporter ATP-binding protein [Nocardioides baekrokdamisoli]|uniref:ABC transporter ATP-binding protein n=1 Tax=Nocardioides baekrokdamisoli TaxID=1804624 RepID=A0A3G9J174_9ACTN|nr:ABC transporter ATP-binding protein [Nocardioides baekrokdamisoli]
MPKLAPSPRLDTVIEASHLTKSYGSKKAVDDLSFSVRPGMVTGFLGPNGAGKSTTMRLLLDLDAATGGSATINGKRYRDHKAPLQEVGALLEAKAIHQGRTARNHLRALAATHGISRKRVDEVIGIVGLESVASKRAGGFSLGMGQRLGIASALLGDPHTLLLDEPVNGLDPEGVLWIRNLLKALAAEGRTVFVSSHLMSEMAVTAEHLIVIGKGKLIADTTVAELTANAGVSHVHVSAADNTSLREALTRDGVTVTDADDGFDVVGVDAAGIGEIALARGIALTQLTTQKATLEEAFMSVTRDAVDYHGSAQ